MINAVEYAFPKTPDGAWKYIERQYVGGKGDIPRTQYEHILKYGKFEMSEE